MKKINELLSWFFKNPPAKPDVQSAAISAFRVFAGLMMLPYGWSKIENYDKLSIDFFGDPIGIGMLPSLWLTIFAQLGCAAMLVLGFQTRFAAFVLFINMAVATKFHFFDPYFVKALPILFLGMYSFLMVSGGGRFALDNLIFKNAKTEQCACANMHALSRAVRLAVCFALSWIVFSNAFSGALSFALLVVIFLMFTSAIYGRSIILGR
ncbi:MAG: DoxX family protein [Opitutales bacterium]|nr:DoxX family protein [Opitutales bacterium]